MACFKPERSCDSTAPNISLRFRKTEPSSVTGYAVRYIASRRSVWASPAATDGNTGTIGIPTQESTLSSIPSENLFAKLWSRLRRRNTPPTSELNVKMKLIVGLGNPGVEYEHT